MSVADELRRLTELHAQGALTDAEFTKAKADLLKRPQQDPISSALSSVTNRQWAIVLHLSQYAGYLVPFAGFLLPILLWQLKKDTVPGLDEHDRNVVNWLISSLIYGFVSGVLTIVLIGFVGLLAIIVMAMVFPIIGAIKANDGIAWRYPTAIRFF